MSRVPKGVASRLAAVQGALPGVLAGVLIAGLVYYLNTDLPVLPRNVAHADAVFGALLGVVSWVLLAALSRRARGGRMGAVVWATSVVLLLAAITFGAHASRFAYYLPPGINQRLLRSGVVLALAGLGCFYIALTHTVRLRPYGWRARAGAAALALLAAATVVERRLSYRPPPGVVARPRASAPEERVVPRLLVVGLDFATLDALLPLAEQGQVPELAALLQRGAYARVRTLSPTWRVPLWATLTTGKYPFKHGVLSPRVLVAPAFGPGARLRLLPQWMGFDVWARFGNAPAASDAGARRVRALWEMLANAAPPTVVVGWPASAPLGPDVVGGVTDRFFGTAGGDVLDVRPAGAAPAVLALRRGPQEQAKELQGFFAAGGPALLANAAATDRWRQGAALTLLERPELRGGGLWLFLRGLGSVSARLYGGYAAARQEGSQDPADVRAAQDVAAYYRYADALLGQVLRRERFDLVAVVSAHGVNAPSNAQRALALLAADRSLAGRTDDAPDGMLLLAGRGVRASYLLGTARLVDVVPTLLYALGLPVADDLDGRVLTDAFTEDFLAQQPLSFLPTYEEPARAPAAN